MHQNTKARAQIEKNMTDTNVRVNSSVDAQEEEKTQTAAVMQSVSGAPMWLLMLAGLALLGTGIYASWVIGKNPSSSV